MGTRRTSATWIVGTHDMIYKKQLTLKKLFWNYVLKTLEKKSWSTF